MPSFALPELDKEDICMHSAQYIPTNCTGKWQQMSLKTVEERIFINKVDITFYRSEQVMRFISWVQIPKLI